MAVQLSERTMNVNDTFQNDKASLNRASDRCDGQGILVLDEAGDDWKSGGTCGAQAHVKVEKDSLDLLFCAHHFRKYEAQLTLQGFAAVVDTRASLTAHNKLVGSEN